MRTDKADVTLNKGMAPYLSPLGAWALAFGCAVGWGAFVMPGTAFLPVGGPMGTIIGLLIGALIMLVFGACYSFLMKKYPDEGGIYTYVKSVFGRDHAFLCGWMLFLTYSAIIWANSTALALIVRGIFGNIFCFGFSYTIAGYTVYFGETLLSFAAIALTCAICAAGKRLTACVQIICALTLFLGVLACFVSVLIKYNGLSGMRPLFASGSDPIVKIMGIVVLAPWAFVGFESISHTVGEFKFSAKKSLPVMAAALLTGFLTYAMLTCCASLAVPDGFGSWTEYISSLSSLQGVNAIPTFRAAREALGAPGLYLMMTSAICGVVTGLIANYVALSRLIVALSKDGTLPAGFGRLNRSGSPYIAFLFIAGLSAVMPFFGRNAIGWIVDVTTIGSCIIYAYVSISGFVIGKSEKNRKIQTAGVFGAIVSCVFIIDYLLPSSTFNRLSREDYLILAIWGVLGMIVFRLLLNKDKNNDFGTSGIVWIMLMFLVIIISVFWFCETATTEAKDVSDSILGSRISRYIVTEQVSGYRDYIIQNLIILMSLITISVAVIFSIFSVIKKREKATEARSIAAEENSRAKSAFLSNMSHDIRTPMNAVTGYTALALRENDIPEKIREYLENIDTSCKHMLSIINDILDMSRIESGKMELDTAPEDIIGVLDEVELMFRHQMEIKELDFTVDCSGVKDRYVICDKQRFNRILLNLISNSCKFTKQGGYVKVTLTETKRTGNDCFYSLSVKDNGIGMSPEFAEKVFDSFTRERSDTVNKIQGTGLGMSITKQLVGLMGGSIRVVTEPGKGTEFIIDVSFPLASEEDIKVLCEEKPEEKTVDFSGKRLLLAEDNPINSEIAKTLLEHEGFEIEVVENGKLALEAIENADPDHFDAILMDIRMPEMNGYEAAAAIKELPSPKCDIPIIAMTANTMSEDISKAHKAGMIAHIGKPIVVEDMLATLTQVLG